MKDEVSAVRAEAQRLKAQGVDIIIGLGHAGYRKDIQLAEEVQELDVVVGGHTNTFLYSGKIQEYVVLHFTIQFGIVRRNKSINIILFCF